MAIVEKVLQDAILSALEDLSNELADGTSSQTPQETRKVLADKLGTEISKQIKTLTVTLPAGIPITVTVGGVPSAGVTTAPIQATVS
jgi:hypothetical protein